MDDNISILKTRPREDDEEVVTRGPNFCNACGVAPAEGPCQDPARCSLRDKLTGPSGAY